MNRLIILCATAAIALAACGSSGSKSSSSSSGTGASTSTTPAASGGGGTQLSLTTDAGGQLKFDKSALSAPAGTVTITLKNTQDLSHDIAIKGGVDVKGSIVGKGATSTVTVKLKPGQYTFYCSVPGHEAAGVNGALTVK